MCRLEIEESGFYSVPNIPASAIEEPFQQLGKKRSSISNREDLAAFSIFSDAVLIELAIQQPMDLDQFLGFSGIGPKKARQYAQDFLQIIRKFNSIEGELILNFHN